MVSGRPRFNHFDWQVWHWDPLNFIIPKLRQNQKVVMQKRSKWKVQHCVHFVWQLWHWTGLKSIGFNSLVVLLRVSLLNLLFVSSSTHLWTWHGTNTKKSNCLIYGSTKKLQARFNAERIIQTQPIINVLIFFWNLKFNWRPSQGGGRAGKKCMIPWVNLCKMSCKPLQ